LGARRGGIHRNGRQEIGRSADIDDVSATFGQNVGSDPILARAEEAAAAALRELPEALILAFDRDLRFLLTAGPAITRLSEPGAWGDGQPVRDAFPRDLWPAVEPLLRSALGGETRTRELWTADEEHCLMIDAGPLSGGAVPGEPVEDPQLAVGVAVVLDITARRRADAYAAAEVAGFEEVFELAPIGTGLLDTEGRWLLVNRALCEITGYTTDELIGRRFDGIVHPDDVFNDAEERSRLLSGETPAYQVEKRYFDAAGETVAAILSMSLVRDRSGEPLHFIAQLQDISERKRIEDNLRMLADHDPLTGVRNRRLFQHDVRMQVARSRRYGEVAGLMLIGLDGFADVNRRHGVDTGDLLLRRVARGLTRRLRQTDLIARVGGDKFAVMLPHIDEEGIAVVAEGLERVIPACSVDTPDGVVRASASIGWMLVDENTASGERALMEADRAMRADKLSKPHHAA
jgi:diguanylate cyclase (GGDEF)-like protein/PAS domain S-box-containing protein